MFPLIYGKIVKSVANKPWLVMVHGFTQNHKIFNKQADFFQDRFNLLMVDLRGHGKSHGFDGPFGIEEYTDDLEKLINHLELASFYYWGTHTGTAIGLVYALRHPESIKGLILEGTVLPGFPMPRVAELIGRARKVSAEKGVEAAKEDWFDHADWFETMRKYPEICRAEEHRSLIREFSAVPWISELEAREVTDVSQRIGEIGQPILLYNGEGDMDDFLLAADQVKAKKPEVRAVTIPKAGGFPCWENPDRVNVVVEEFLNDIS